MTTLGPVFIELPTEMSLSNYSAIISHGNDIVPAVVVVEEKVKQVRNGSFLWVWPILITVVTLGVLGNFVVLIAVSFVRRFRKPGNYLVANLSLASLLIMVSLVSASVQTEWPMVPYGPWVCRFFPGLHSFMIPAEGFTIMCLSLERTRVVREPFQTESRRAAIRKIALIWTAALALELPRGLFFYTYDETCESFYKCRNTKLFLGSPWPYIVYISTVFIVSFLLPSLVMLKDFIRLAGQLKFLITCKIWLVHSSYYAYRQRLIRNALIFTSIFILVQLPGGVYYVFYRMPDHLISPYMLLWVKEWRNFFFQLYLIHGFFYPLIIFALSTEMRKYLCKRERQMEAREISFVVVVHQNHCPRA